MSTSLETLPDIVFAEKNPDVIETQVLARFEEITGRKLYPGDPARLFLLGFVKYLSLQRSLIDFSGKQNLLQYSSEGYLQHVAALVGTEILEPCPAVTTLKFTLSAPLGNRTAIKKGTRATPGNKVYFATAEDAEIPTGGISVSVGAVCTQTGAVGNGYYPGQVNQLSDPVAYMCAVENITLTQGGADREDLEAFRERTRVAPESYSSAGPYGAYMFWAKTASQLIVDVSVTSPNPGEVEIIPLMKDGQIPAQSLLDEVYAECNDSRRRPLTDKVIVNPPEETRFDIRFQYFITRKDSATGLSLQNKVNDAVQRYILWQKSALGRDVNPSKLIEMLMETGIKRVDVAEPTYRPVAHGQIAVANVVAADYGGLEDD